MKELPVAASTLEDDLLAVLRHATGTSTLEYAAPPRRLTGGFWATLLAFRLEGAPSGWGGDLVARVMPTPAIAAKETIVQAAVSAQGYPTPAVRLAGGPEDGLGQSFMVMDLAAGDPLLSGLSGARTVASLPRLARRLPEALGSSMARLHRLDPAPVRDRLGAATAGGVGIDAVVEAFALAAATVGRDDLGAAARWLVEHPPPASGEVICHGDLHPFNLLVDAHGAVTVLDWSAALVGPPLYDVAFTGLLLAEPPVAVPRALRPVVRAAGRWLAGRFGRSYERHHGTSIDPASLRWYEGVVSLRALTEVAHWVAAGVVEERAGHPWMVSGPAFADRLTSLTGTVVRPG